MRRITYWALSTITVLVLLFGYHTSTSGVAASSSTQTPITGSAPGSAPTSSSGSTGTTSGAGASPPDSSTRTDGSTQTTSPDAVAPRTVTGSVARTRWGPVQVQLTVSGTKITDVSVIQYPDGNGRDQEINSQALPILIQETINAQSSHIDMVSGATYTSDGYLQSLQSALDQAHL